MEVLEVIPCSMYYCSINADKYKWIEIFKFTP
jgi:hypothetical protein